MANKRELKQVINCVCDDLLVEGVAASLYGNDVHKENTEALLYSIVRLQRDFTARVSHPEPGMPPKAYYKDLCEKFAAQVSELADQIHNI